MLIASYFFYKKSYLNYDRMIVCAASLFLASKIFNEYGMIKQFIDSYYQVVNLANGVETPPKLEAEVSFTLPN